MKVYHAIICCERDIDCLPEHIANVELNLGLPTVDRCVFFGQPMFPQRGPPSDIKTCGFDHIELYENLPIKTFCLLQYALLNPDWDYLLKTDANAVIDSIDWQAASQHELIGNMSETPSSRTYHSDKVEQKVLSATYDGPRPNRWVGGPAYCMSRRLAHLVVSRGIWWARGWAYEDLMVSYVAEQAGIVAHPGIKYQEPEK